MNILYSGVVIACFIAAVSLTGPGVDGIVHGEYRLAKDTLQSVEVWPASASIPQNTTFGFRLDGIYAGGGTRDLSQKAVWESKNPEVATIDAAGRVQAHAPGEAVFEASVGEHRAQARLVVVSADLVLLDVFPGDAQLAQGSGLSYLAVGTFAGGWAEDLTSQVLWSSSDETVATVDPNGRVRAHAVGVAEICAAYGEYSIGYRLRVTPGPAIANAAE